MKLSKEQEKQVADWVRAGASLADVQKRLESELGVTVTYMEVRFLVDDLDVELVDPVKPKTDKVVETDLSKAPKKKKDGVSVSVDRVSRANAVISGQATFKSGDSIAWYIDQMGRLALDPGSSTYRPTEDEIMDFQEELQKILRKKGF